MRIVAILAFIILTWTNVAHAAPPVCNAGAEGTIVYNKDRKLVQFCNGTEWIGMVAKLGVNSGSGTDTLADLNCTTNEVPTWNGTVWECGAGGGGLWTDAGSYLTYAGADKGVKIQSVTGMNPPKNTLADLGCSTNQILKWDGDSWECASEGSGTLPALTSARIWVGNGSNAATAVAVSGDATLSNAGALTIANNAINSAKIQDGTVSNADLAGSIAISKLAVPGGTTTFLRADGTWVAPSGSDNLGNHTATQALNMGGFNITGAGTVTATQFLYSSDARLKADIEAIANARDKLGRIHGVTYYYKNDAAKTPRVGVLAQDVKAVLPQAVATGADGMMAVDYPALVPVLIEAVNELSHEVKTLRSELATLKQQKQE